MRNVQPTAYVDWIRYLASFNGHVVVAARADGELLIETPGELSGLLGWLATLPLAEVQVEPVGLRALYDQYHSP